MVLASDGIAKRKGKEQEKERRDTDGSEVGFQPAALIPSWNFAIAMTGRIS